jgi:hypothetical protein
MELAQWAVAMAATTLLFVLGLGMSMGRDRRRAGKRCMAVAALLASAASLTFAVMGKQPMLLDWLYKAMNK